MRSRKSRKARGVYLPIRETLDIHEAAELTKCHPDTLRKMAKAREVPSTKIGRAWVFSTALLQQWIDARCRAAAVTRDNSLKDDVTGGRALVAQLDRLLTEQAATKPRKKARRNIDG
jgi:excisionase family DNA binding protein